MLPTLSWSQDRPDPNRPGAREQFHYDVPAKLDIDYEALDAIDISSSPLGVVALPETVGKTLTGLFSKYTKYVAPNGKPIHILGQDRVTDLQMVRARGILSYHLTDVPGSEFGSDKAAIANRMADVRATLIYTNTQARAFAIYPILEPSELSFQDLYATESPVEGSYEYVHNAAKPGAFFTRDAAYEEIMHLVHEKGIEEALPEFHEAVVYAEKRAVEAGIYHYGRPAPHEYIITGFDVYFGLWDHDPQGDGGSFGKEYPFHNRAEMKAADRPLFELVEGFWPRHLTYDAYVDPAFEGTFSIALDADAEYTLKSRHLVNVILTGGNDTGLTGNDEGNRLIGNEGDNRIRGGAGDDVIVGGEGTDTAVFAGDAEDYLVEHVGPTTIVHDGIPGRDGVDTLSGIEVLEFRDKKVNCQSANRV